MTPEAQATIPQKQLNMETETKKHPPIFTGFELYAHNEDGFFIINPKDGSIFKWIDVESLEENGVYYGEKKKRLSLQHLFLWDTETSLSQMPNGLIMVTASCFCPLIFSNNKGLFPHGKSPFIFIFIIKIIFFFIFSFYSLFIFLFLSLLY